MSDPTEQPESAPQDTRAEDLTDDLAKKYDPERLLKIVSRRAGRGESLDHHVRTRYERKFGIDLSHVRVYTGEFAEEFNRQRNAYAVTIGGTGMIMMGGSPDKSPDSAAGRALLAHELTHVAQATRGARGLHRKSSFDGGMPFAEEHEEEAEMIEDETIAEELGAAALHDGKEGAKMHGAVKHAAVEGYRKQVEKIKERVIELAGETARQQYMRNGPPVRRA